MRLQPECVRLPLAFDAARLGTELAQFEESDWRADDGGFVLPLVSAGGDPSSDARKGPMRATPHLSRCPYMQEVLASLRSPVGRTRLIRFDGNAAPRIDSTYYAVHRARVHVPVVTDSAAMVSCGGVSVHMAAGEAWILDPSKPHHVSEAMRAVHLVCDTVPSPEFRDIVNGTAPAGARALELESRNVPVVMSPAEQEALVELLDGVPAVVRWFLHDWRELWHQYGESPGGWARFRALLTLFDAALESLPEREIVRELLVVPALNPEVAARVPAITSQRRIERPVFIVSPPRSGSTLLFQTLWRSPSVFTPCGESHEIIEGIEGLHPAQRGWESNRLTADDASPAVAAELEARFLAELRARDGSRTLPARVRMLEKTTKNLLRIPFLRALYPDAFFIVLHRDARETIGSLLDVWRAQTMVAYRELPGWQGPGWTLTLVPGWREVNGKPLEEIVAHQWSEGMRIMLDDLEPLDPRSWCVASYDALIAEPQKEIERLCALTGLAWDRELAAPLPLAVSTLTEPSPDKWLRNREAIDRIADRIRPVAERARELFARRSD
ncbi:MAG TPA: sulfotransferase [Thermoanaerobaculia bacterium]|nr:sulfotransferase [Thermoanaerobaculia bacterium]